MASPSSLSISNPCSVRPQNSRPSSIATSQWSSRRAPSLHATLLRKSKVNLKPTLPASSEISASFPDSASISSLRPMTPQPLRSAPIRQPSKPPPAPSRQIARASARRSFSSASRASSLPSQAAPEQPWSAPAMSSVKAIRPSSPSTSLPPSTSPSASPSRHWQKYNSSTPAARSPSKQTAEAARRSKAASTSSTTPSTQPQEPSASKQNSPTPTAHCGPASSSTYVCDCAWTKQRPSSPNLPCRTASTANMSGAFNPESHPQTLSPSSAPINRKAAPASPLSTAAFKREIPSSPKANSDSHPAQKSRSSISRTQPKSNSRNSSTQRHTRCALPISLFAAPSPPRCSSQPLLASACSAIFRCPSAICRKWNTPPSASMQHFPAQ